MILALCRRIRPVLAGAVILAVPAFALCSLMLGGTRGAAAVALGADDPIHAGLRVLAPREPAGQPLAVARSGDTEEEVIPSIWVFTDRGNASPWQGGGSPTSTTISG